jgi:aspartyl-tRNA(Asn)/glutamyl-tRNA(Gln) amidotransferase subunit A
MPPVSAIDELAFASIDQLVGALERGELSSRDATMLMLQRVERLDARINGYITVTADRALAEAAAADERRAAVERSALLCVPIAVKDLCDTAGVRTTAGSRVLADNVPEQDATVVRRLREAGAVLLGKTHMAEFAYGHPHPDFGPSRTPWDTSRSASGSSGGSGAVVAAGLAYAALGSDTGGSIRGPAAVCAITGHKPTYGLVSRAGVVPLSWSLDHVGPLTRSARDAALVLEAIAGHDPRDAASAGLAGWQASLERRTDLRGLRIGLLVELTEGMDAECPALFDAALATLRELGASIEPVNVPDLQYVNAIAFGVMEPEAASYHARWLRERPQDYAPATRRGLEAASVMFATQYVDAQRLRARFNVGFARLFERFDVLCLPSQPELPTLITADDDSGSHDEWDLRHTVIANLTGVPAVSIPCGFTQAQLPFSLQLLAPPFADALALDVADAYQSATNWHLRRPPDFV